MFPAQFRKVDEFTVVQGKRTESAPAFCMGDFAEVAEREGIPGSPDTNAQQAAGVVVVDVQQILIKLNVIIVLQKGLPAWANVGQAQLRAEAQAAFGKEGVSEIARGFKGVKMQLRRNIIVVVDAVHHGHVEFHREHAIGLGFGAEREAAEIDVDQRAGAGAEGSLHLGLVHEISQQRGVGFFRSRLVFNKIKGKRVRADAKVQPLRKGRRSRA